MSSTFCPSDIDRESRLPSFISAEEGGVSNRNASCVCTNCLGTSFIPIRVTQPRGVININLRVVADNNNNKKDVITLPIVQEKLASLIYRI